MSHKSHEQSLEIESLALAIRNGDFEIESCDVSIKTHLNSTALAIIRASQTTLPTSFFFNSLLTLEPINQSSHLLLRPPLLFIFINSASTANGKIKIQSITIICSFLALILIVLRCCPLKTP